VKAWVRYLKVRTPKLLPIKDEDIQIDDPRPPTKGLLSAERFLELFETPEYLTGCQLCFNLDNTVDKEILLPIPGGLGFVEGRPSENPILLASLQPCDCSFAVGDLVTNIGTNPDYGSVFTPRDHEQRPASTAGLTKM
jgi:hypothetical protein